MQQQTWYDDDELVTRSTPRCCLRRGRCPHRPAGLCVRAALAGCTRCHSCCRGALYMRPAQPSQPPGPGTQRTRFGRICNPPLRTRLRFPRRGRCPHRPAGLCVRAALAGCTRCHSCCRGALYMRPAQPSQPPGPGTQRTRFGRICNPPLRTCPRFPRRGGLYGRPGPGSRFAPGSDGSVRRRGTFGDGASDAAVRARFPVFSSLRRGVALVEDGSV